MGIRVTRRSALLIASVLIAMTIGAPTTAAAAACPKTCDAACGACCSVWSIRASCGDGGDSLVERGFATWADASDAASAANAAAAECDGASASCPRALRCGTPSVTARWEAVCADGDAVPPPPPKATAPLDAMLASSGGAQSALDDAGAAVDALLTGDRPLTKAGAKACQAAKVRLAAAKEALTKAAAPVRAAREAGEWADSSVAPWKASIDEAVATANAASAEAKRIADDPKVIDKLAIARREAAEAAKARAEQRIVEAAERAEAAAAAKRAREEAAAEAKRAREQAAREAAEAKAGAAAEGAGAAAATRTSRDDALREDLGRRAKEAVEALGAIDARAADASGRTAAVATKPDVAATTRAEAAKLRAKLETIRTNANALAANARAASLDGSVQRGTTKLADVRTKLAKLEGELAVAIASADRLAAAPAKAEQAIALVPSCDVAFDSGSEKLTLAIDGARPVALPAKVHVTSGRHALSIRQPNGTTAKRTELLVCGRLTTMHLGGAPASPGGDSKGRPVP